MNSTTSRSGQDYKRVIIRSVEATCVKQARSMIFVVDNEPAIGSSLVAILALRGLRAKCFTSPLEALKVARSEPPDVLVSDVMMPDIGGIDLAILMTKQFPTCQILLFSGVASTSDLLKTARTKGYEFHLLSKPVPPAIILDEIGKLIARIVA